MPDEVWSEAHVRAVLERQRARLGEDRLLDLVAAWAAARGLGGGLVAWLELRLAEAAAGRS